MPFRQLFMEELARLRENASGFAEKHPALDVFLQDDPDVERLFQGAAFLFAGISRRLNDDYPAISHQFSRVLHPHVLHEFPAATTVGFTPASRVIGDDHSCSFISCFH